VLSAGLEKRGNIAVASGGLTDVWRGQYNSTQVAIKAFRIYPAQNLKEAKEVRLQPVRNVRSLTEFQILWKRVPMWKKLSHENILSFRGVNMTLFQLALVYDWGQSGNISQYIVSHPGASRPALVRMLLPNHNKVLTLFSFCVVAAWRREGVTIPSFSRYLARGFERGRWFPSGWFQLSHLWCRDFFLFGPRLRERTNSVVTGERCH